MSLYWVDHPDQTATVYLPEVAPSLNPMDGKYQTWFWRNWQPDGICMNCRKRPGLMDPVGGTYACEDCHARCAAGLRAHQYGRPHDGL